MTLETHNNRFSRFAILVGVVGTGVLFTLPGLAETTFYRGRVMISPAEEMRLAAEKVNSGMMEPVSSNVSPRPTTPTATTPMPEGSQVTPGTTPSDMGSTSQQVPGTAMEPTPSTSMPQNSQATPSQTSGSPASDSSSSTQTVVEVAANNRSFTTLTAALKAAGLTDALSQSGPFTIFAPTDEAFAALPQGILQELLKPENKAVLVKVLTYHVVPGRVTSNQLSSGNVSTVEGKSVAVQVNDGNVRVNDARVIQADVNASNGIIHAIDKVILPPDM
jgi:uncharacterized surface protein with fasciclin (FAS1) repeats